jgi:16S rRNA (cytosine967-C5)-methyltransferase
VKPGVATRLTAAELVSRVMEDGAHSNVLLAGDLGPRHGEIERLVMDTLRWLPATDAVLESLSTRPLADLDAMVRNALRVGAMELQTGGDPHGVVDSTVEVVRRSGSPRATGFVNAVLRRIARGDVPEPADRTASSHATATQPWIRQRLVDAWGEPAATAFLMASARPPRIGVRLRPGAPAVGEPVPGIGEACLVDDRGEIDTARGHVVMDPASVAVALAVEAAPGHRVLDMAAAPGNKTGVLADRVGDRGHVVAADAHGRRARSAARRLRAMGIDVPWVIADGRSPPFSPATFDRVLLDAPCTGLGTIRRRPEIAVRLEPEAPARMAGLQRTLASAALRLVRPGGRFVYSVCTVFPEETVEIAELIGGRVPAGLPGEQWGSGLLLAPHTTGTDGMFITVVDVPD